MAASRRVSGPLMKTASFSSALISGNIETVQEAYNDKQISKHESKAKPYSEVPGPKGLPFIGNSWRFAPLIGQYHIKDLDKLTIDLYKRYGKIAKVEGLIGHPDLLFVYDGDEIRNVFRREEALPHRPSMPSLRHYKASMRKDFFGDNLGLIGVHGEKWDKFRAEVQHVLLQPTTAKKYILPLNDIAQDFIERMHEMRDGNGELPGHFLHELYKWALESVGRVALDTRLGCLSKDCNEESKRIINAINTFFWTISDVELRMPVWRIYKTPTYKRYISALDSFIELCMKHINLTMEKVEKFADGTRNEADISIVERIVKKTGNRKIAAVLALDLFLVGVDTTSVAASSTIYQLSKNPEKQEKLFKELKSVLPDRNTQVNQEVLENIPYIRACIKETLRMYPVTIANGRSLQSDAVINGYTIPKGTHVIFPHYVVSNLEHYFPEPNKFIPERWIKHSEEDTAKCPHAGQKIHPFVSLPFGFGRRMCIGRRFAEMELNMLLAKIFRNYRVEYNYGELTYKVNPTYIPAKPLKFKLMEREV